MICATKDAAIVHENMLLVTNENPLLSEICTGNATACFQSEDHHSASAFTDLANEGQLALGTFFLGEWGDEAVCAFPCHC